MKIKLTYFLLILFGLLFAFMGVFIGTDISSIDSLIASIVFIGLGLFFCCIGISFLISHIFKSIKERKVLKDGIPGSGMVLSVSNSTAIKVEGKSMDCYFITVRFINHNGEKCDYELSNDYDVYQTAYLIKKGKINIKIQDDACIIEEEFEEAYNISESVAKRTIKKYLTKNKIEKITDKVNNKILDNTDKIFYTVYYVEVFKIVVLLICIFFVMFPLFFFLGPIAFAIYAIIVYLFVKEIKRRRKAVKDAIEKDKNKKKK